MTTPSWRWAAVCAQTDPEPFFPEKGANGNQIAQAKDVCASCPVQALCLDWAIDHHERYGIWGGMTDLERRREAKRRNQRRAAA
jgi:WhiB family redox-sensing transcriptional regulator